MARLLFGLCFPMAVRSGINLEKVEKISFWSKSKMDHKSAGFISNLTACTCVRARQWAVSPLLPTQPHCPLFSSLLQPMRHRPSFFLCQKTHTPTLPLSTVSYSFFCKSLPECTVFSSLLPQPTGHRHSFLLCCQKSTLPLCLCQLFPTLSLASHCQSALLSAPSLLLQPMRDRASFCDVKQHSPTLPFSLSAECCQKWHSLPLVTKVRTKTNLRGRDHFSTFHFLCYATMYFYYIQFYGRRSRATFFPTIFFKECLCLIGWWSWKGALFLALAECPVFSSLLLQPMRHKPSAVKKAQSHSAFALWQLLPTLSLTPRVHSFQLPPSPAIEAMALFPCLLSNSACVGVSAVGRQTVHCS